MTEDEAKEQVRALSGATAFEQLERFAALVTAENERQNLISRSTVPQLWSRHILDSAQLIRWDAPGLWVDVGTGGGFPGLVVATLRNEPTLLVEPRPLRATFLRSCIGELKLTNARVTEQRVEQCPAEIASAVSARAVASIGDLFASTARFRNRKTRYVLPRGKSAEADIAAAKRKWQGMFHVEQSLTSADAGIVIATGVGHR